MGVRTLALASGVLVSLAASACSTPAPAVKGVQNPGGGPAVAAQMNADPSLTQGMLPGSSSYIGASVDGSLIGFLTAEGKIVWYKTH